MDLLREFMMDKMDERDALKVALADVKDHGDRARMAAQLRALDEFLSDGEPESGDGYVESDPLAAYWEAQLARGEEPDLDMTVEDLRNARR